MNDKQKSILKRFLLFILLFVFLCLIGISDIFALETKTIYPNSNFNQNANNYLKMNSDGTLGITNTNLTIQGVSYGFYFTLQETITLNRTYTLVINFMDADLLKTFQSSYVHIQNCSGSSCTDSAIVSVTKNNNNANSNKLTIQFSPTSVGNYFTVGLASDGPPYQALTGISTYGIKNVQLDVTDTTQDIINNQTNNTNNIINNNNSNTQEIIENQNSNASAIQDTINSNFNDCHTSVNLFNANTGVVGYIKDDGTIGNSNSNFTSDYIQIGQNNNFTISSNVTLNNIGIAYFDSSKNIILPRSDNRNTKSVTKNSGSAYYVRFWVEKSGTTMSSSVVKSYEIQLQLGNTATTYEPYGEQICINKLDEQTNAINDLNDSINSTDFDVSGLDNAVGWLPAGPVDSILNLPLNLFNAYTTALGLTCSPLNIPLPYVNKNLPIPCIRSILQEIGISTWWEGFGYLAAAIILYNYLLNLYTWVDKTLTLRENTMPGYYDDNFGGGA